MTTRRAELLAGRIAIGLVIALVVAVTTDSVRRLRQWEPASSLTGYWFGGNRIVEMAAPRGWVLVGEPIFHQGPTGKWSQVGYVERVGPGERSTESVFVRWHAAELDPRAHEVAAYEYRGSLIETLQVMFPPEKREVIRERLVAAVAESGETLGSQLLPLVERGVRESLPVFEREWIAAFERHRDGWQAIGSRHKDEWLSRLVPLAKDPVIPIARQQLEPTFQQIGRELWDRASLWRFTWRAIYDRTPLPRRDLTREEWARFVEEEVIPVIESHADDIAVATQATLLQIVRHPQVRAELGETFADLADDPEVRNWLVELLRETLVDSPAVRQVWLDVWTGEEARAAFSRVGDRIEPLVRELGGELFGTPATGIDPGFARVLRHQILGKDRRWLIASARAGGEPGAGAVVADSPQVIRRGTGDPTYPLLPPVAAED